jgi:hypothetical protein
MIESERGHRPAVVVVLVLMVAALLPTLAAGSSVTLLGNSTVGARRGFVRAGRSRAFRFRALASGPAGEAHIYLDRGGTPRSLTVGLYSNVGSRPGRLLSMGSIDTPVRDAWNPVVLGAVVLRAGRAYWLAVLGEGGVLRFRERRQASCLGQTSLQANLISLPASWGRARINKSCGISAYVTPLVQGLPPGAFMPLRPFTPVGAIPALVPPRTMAPSNTVSPTISGTLLNGEVLTASNGEWTESPTSYSYQWQRCNAAGGECAPISAATGTSHTLTSSDVAHTLRVVVSASNSVGKSSATSAQTATVTAHIGPQTSCFAEPGACGYPDPSYSNVGPSVACSSLTPSGELTVTTEKAKIENKDITGGVAVDAKNVILTNDCITTNGGGSGSSSAVNIGQGDTGTQITHSDISGANSTDESVEEALSNNYSNSSTVADHDYIYNCGECVHGEWKLTNSYVTVSANISGAHYEDIYCNDETFIAEHDVLINPHGQTANLFCDTNLGGGGPAENHITVTNSLLAGAGYSLYPQGNSTSVGSSTMTITDNRFARCLGKPIFDGSGTTCQGLGEGEADSHGYYPNGGYYGQIASVYCPPTPGQEWSNNVWDDNNETVTCE